VVENTETGYRMENSVCFCSIGAWKSDDYCFLTFNTNFWLVDDPSSQETEAGGSQVQNQPGLHSEFQVSLHYIVRLRLEKTN
jgi:hypothetical protein